MMHPFTIDQPSLPKMSEGLLRQRRNLMVTSLIIIFLRYGEVTIEKVGALGIELKFQNMKALYVSLWVIFVYFFIRYHQYLQQEPDFGIKSAFWAKVDERCLNKLSEAATKQFTTVIKSPIQAEFRLSSFKRKSAFFWSRTLTTKLDSYGDAETSEYTVNILRFWFDFLIAAGHVVINRSAITDYIFPLMLAAFALFYGWSGNWPGTLCNILGVSIMGKLCA